MDSKSEVRDESGFAFILSEALYLPPHSTLPGHRPGKSKPPRNLAYALHPYDILFSLLLATCEAILTVLATTLL